MDTDSSLPALLFLAVSLPVFGWASVIAGLRRRPVSPIAMLSRSPAPGMALTLAVAAAGVGAAAIAIGGMLAPEWPAALRTPAAVVAAALLLAAVHGIADRVAARFPEAAGRLARPRKWFDPDGGIVAAANGGDAAPANGGGNGGGGEPADPNYGAYPEPRPLTSAELLNLDNHDIDMVRSISRMDDRDVKDIMVPRLDVDAVEASISLPALASRFIASRHTRLPVYRETMDEVVGIVHISDALGALFEGRNDDGLPESIMREPEFVVEHMAVDDLLHLMRRQSLQMAIVVDEFGGVEGIVTLEDVLEEIVGEIEDEFTDDEEDEVTPDGDTDGAWLVNATLPLEAVTQATGAALADEGEVNTIGGYVYAKLGRMPAVGDVIKANAVSVEVTQMRGRRIQQLRLRTAVGEGNGGGNENGNSRA